jgi:type IV pilus assembly protein PilA
MIVIAIIGILGTMALANYTTIFVARSHMSEGVTLAAGMKPGVAEAANGFGTLTGITTGVYQGLPAVATDVKGKYVSQVAVVDGVITATLGGDASAVVAGKRLVLTPTLRAGSVAWICSSDADSKYLPATCRP